MNADRASMIEFAGFRFDLERRLLVDINDRVIDLTPKAADILHVLVTNAGDLVSKEDLMAQAWPDSFVEEANLSHHIFKLRKALGEDDGHKFIETLPKKGYRFVGEIGAKSRPSSEQDTIGPEPASQSYGFMFAIGLALAVIVIGAGWWFISKRNPTTEQPQSLAAIRSIAVMPFTNESGAEEVEYLADGMTETLISSLAQIPTIGVKPRSLVARYKGVDVSAVTVAAELNVQAVLFGRITRRGDEITLFLSLIDPANEFQIWGKQYNRKLADLSVLQAEIGRDVVQSLETKITGVDETRLAKNYSQNAEAYRLYLLGDYHWAKFTEDNFWKAKEFYEKAIAIDPTYALAYTGLSNTFSVLGVNGHIPVSDAREKSRIAAERAVQLDDRLAEARVSLGAYKMFFEWDLDGAEAEFRRAIELNSNYAVPHELMAYSLRARRRFDEAIAEAKRAVEIDPTNLLMRGDLGTTYRFAGNAEEAIKVNRSVMDLNPGFADVYFEDALAHSQLGDHASAIRQVTKAAELDSKSTKIAAGVGIIYARAGNHEQARKVIASLEKEAATNYVSPLDIALIYSAMGDREKAFSWLEKAFTAGSGWLFELDIDPVYDPIRDDPRFTTLMKRVGLIK